MLLHSLDGHLLPVEDTRGQGCFHISLFEDFTEVFDLSGTGRGNDWEGDVIADVVDQFNVETTVGAILIKQIMESLVT